MLAAAAAAATASALKEEGALETRCSRVNERVASQPPSSFTVELRNKRGGPFFRICSFHFSTFPLVAVFLPSPRAWRRFRRRLVAELERREADMGLSADWDHQSFEVTSEAVLSFLIFFPPPLRFLFPWQAFCFSADLGCHRRAELGYCWTGRPLSLSLSPSLPPSLPPQYPILPPFLHRSILSSQCTLLKLICVFVDTHALSGIVFALLLALLAPFPPRCPPLLPSLQCLAT